MFLFASATFGARRYLRMPLCPLCAGVSLTWIWMLAGMWLGYLPIEKYEIMTATLMGGSVIGIVKKLEEKWGNRISNTQKENGKRARRVELLEEKMKNCC